MTPTTPTYLEFRRRHPATAAWLAIGLQPRAALALVNAGVRSPKDLEKWSRESLLTLRSIGKTTLARIEEFLGRKLRSRTEYWLEKGVPGLVAKALVRAGFNSCDDFSVYTREQFLRTDGMGEKILAHCERVLGHPLPSPRTYWIELGLDPRTAMKLARAGVSDLPQLRNRINTDLRKIGLNKAEIYTCRGLLWNETERGPGKKA